MGKTTNILDLNNRLTKVEKENVAQNSYTSLKNKPKINSVTLTGNKTLADIGAAAAADVGSLSALTTTDKSSVVGAVNEVNCNIAKKEDILKNTPLTLSFNGNCGLLYIIRKALQVSVLISFDYWSDEPTILFGTIPSGITITKDTLSNSITITSSLSSAITCILI